MGLSASTRDVSWSVCHSLGDLHVELGSGWNLGLSHPCKSILCGLTQLGLLADFVVVLFVLCVAFLVLNEE
jgi:hypothetical protein